MGYYTTYDLTLRDPKDMTVIEDSHIIEKVVAMLKEKDIIGYALSEDLSCYDSAKWYDYEQDMLGISREVPDVLFCLWGCGEDAGDLWTQYFLNGKSQYCRAEIPPFDPAKLE